MSVDPAAFYAERERVAGAAAEALGRRALVVSRLRVGAFLLAVAPLLLLETSPRSLWPWLLAGAGVFALLFFILVVRHRRLMRELERERLRGEMAREGMARLTRRWSDLPLPALGEAPEAHPWAADLDTLGPGSMGQLLGRPTTAPGRAALRRALLDPFALSPADPLVLLRGAREEGSPTLAPSPEWEERLRARQGEVETFGGDPILLEAIELEGRTVRGEGSLRATRAFLTWARGEDRLPSHPWLLPAGWFLTVATPASFTGWLLGWIHGGIPLLGALLSLGVCRRLAGIAHPALTAAEGGEGDPLRWAGILAVARGREDASRALLALRRITDVGAVRHSSLAYFPLAALLAWDVHLLAALERWRRRWGKEVDGWVLEVAEVELLTALGGLRFENPEWSFPQIALEGGIRGEALGHPLLNPETMVANDVALPEAGRLLLVTGSNMSGKSTLLRAVGTNQLLAMMGAPVAARSLETLPILPFAAMRVTDSLTRGVSFFLAELHRLKAVVEGARHAPVLFLLDEILQGTNTAERRIAARIVLVHLLGTRSVGAVTTHDLTLAEDPALEGRLEHVHFREEVTDTGEGRRLHFDHTLRPGPATSRNALLLLEMVGLGED